MNSSPSTFLIPLTARIGGQAPLLASLAVLLAAGVLPISAQQQRVEVGKARSSRVEPADSTERELRKLQHQLDSLARVYNEHDELTIAERKRVEQQLGRTVHRLEEISARMNLAPDRAMPVTDQIRIQMTPRTVERAAASMSRALMQVREAEQARPRGWIGLVVQGPGLTPRVEGGELLVRYFAYPRVVSVDPSSPAQRAGLIPNDTLLAYDGVDVSENDISFTRLLRPNARVNIRIRREGKVREVPVTVAAAPMRIVQRRDDESRSRESWTVAILPEAPSFPSIPMSPPSPGAPTRVIVRSATPALAPMDASGFPYGTGVAGAQLSTISDGLGKALGVSSGVLVTSSPVGSPANESGLVDGDVISKVAGQGVRRVTEVRDLVALASENGDHAVELEIVRQKKPMKVMLRW
jgi:C-terminal processing protease CtpA/Prc